MGFGESNDAGQNYRDYCFVDPPPPTKAINSICNLQGSMSSSLSPRRRRFLVSGSSATTRNVVVSKPPPAAAYSYATTPKTKVAATPPPIVSEARAYLQRFQSSPERRQPAASSSSSSSGQSSFSGDGSRPQETSIANDSLPPIDTRTLSYSNEDENTSPNQYDEETNLHQVMSNESTFISEVTGGTGLSSPQNADDDYDVEQQAGNLQQQLVVAEQQPVSSSWWRNMVQQLEHKHNLERKHWQEHLQLSENKKSQYKSELRETIANQLKWLEERMTSPNHMIPNATSSTSVSSREEKSHHKWKQKAIVLQDLMHLTEQQHQVETTEWQQKVATLETTLEETRDKYTKQLETAFAHQEYMEGLVQQWKETADGAIEEHRKLQYKENESTLTLKQVREELEKERQRNKVLPVSRIPISREGEIKRLHETLSLERKRAEEAERKCRSLQTDVQSQAEQIAALTTSADQASNSAAKLAKQLEELQAMYQELSNDQEKDREEHNLKVQRLEEDLKVARDEASTFRAQAADFSEAATTAKSQCTNLQRSLSAAESPMAIRSPVVQHRIEWDDKLDRALAERDLFQQEASALKAEREKLSEQLQLSSDFVIQYEHLAQKHAELIERLAIFEHQSDHQVGEDQITSMRREIQNLQEALANEGDRHAQEVRKLKAELLQFESETKLNKIKNEQGSTRNLEYEAELNSLRSKLKQKDTETEERCRQLSAQKQATIDALQSKVYTLEQHIEKYKTNELPQRLNERVRELEEELANRPVAALQRLAEMSEEHTRDQRTLMDQLDAAASENKNLHQQTKSLSLSLADLKNLHAKSLDKYDRLLLEKQRLQHQLEGLHNERRSQDIGVQAKSSPERSPPTQHQHEDDKLIETLSGLQKDVRDVQQQLQDASQRQSLEHTFLEKFRSDLSSIQTSLNDAVVELTLETDALLESREAIKTVASDASSLMGERDSSSKLKFIKQQEKLLSEFSELRDNINATANSRSAENQSCLKDLIDDIRSKEASLSATQTELQFIKEKLESEIAARQKAESRIEEYADQADAYEEQLMALQSSNTSLMKKLHVAGLKIDASLTSMPNCDDEVNSAFATPRCFLNSGQRDESLPVLDEALALAENISSLVRDGEQEGNFMDMLEAMANLMEQKQTIVSASPASPKRSSTPRGYRSTISFDETISDRTLSTAPSSPVSPLKRHRKVFDEATGNIEVVHEDEHEEMKLFRKSKLAIVVEQLYARCQMLERERSEMMEATLEILEATKEANTAEVDAVLAGARRRAVDDILEMHRSSKKDQERVLKRIMMNQSKSIS